MGEAKPQFHVTEALILVPDHSPFKENVIIFTSREASKADLWGPLALEAGPVRECVTSASLDIGVEPKEESGKSVQWGQCPGGQDVRPGGGRRLS